MSTFPLLQTFAQVLTAKFASLGKSEKEAQLSSPVETLVTQVAGELGSKVILRRETRVAEIGGRPDFGVDIEGALCGYIELKAPGFGARPDKFKGRDKEQWTKFKSLPNLIYTDGSEWTLFQAGEQKQTFKLAGDAAFDGDKAVSEDNAKKLDAMLQGFLSWKPIVPSAPKELAKLLAPLCRLIRSDVLEAIEDENSNLSQLAKEWRTALFPDADNPKFADAYAQTLTYGLLLARLESKGDLTLDNAVTTLKDNHNLLGQALKVLGQTGAREELGVGPEILLRVLNALDASVWQAKSGDADPWLYFYEDFLDAYDPKLRADAGVYYTPVEIIGAQVRLVDELLQTHLGKAKGLLDEKVIILDPAAGTGAYPLAVLERAIEKAIKRGPDKKPDAANSLAKRLFAFEFLVGPYAVAHLRLTQAIQAAGGQLSKEGAQVFLCDTLESPNVSPQNVSLFNKELAAEHTRALKVKKQTNIVVCLGNPPYDRQQRDNPEEALRGGWVRFGDDKDDKANRPIFEDFLKPAKDAGAGGHLKNIYNDYVYFWRWALWKTFESRLPTPNAGDGELQRGGIVSFITASSYLRGPGFIGMRQVMRQTFDELWILDLEGDSLGARKTENLFNIQTPVAIAIGVRREKSGEGNAKIHYAKLVGSRKEKREQLAQIAKFSDIQWSDCPDEDFAPFLPAAQGDYAAWPKLTDLFPWQHSGAQFKRKWPIAETEELLRERWETFASAPKTEKAGLFKESRDRKITAQYRDWRDGEKMKAVEQETSESIPAVELYAFRSFDRQLCFADNRLADFPKPTLWKSYNPNQIFLTGLLTGILGIGPALTATPYVPDLHHFRGSFGGKDVIPLWRDGDATQANITAGVLEQLAEVYGQSVAPADLFAYVYALLFPRAYVERFSEELLNPGPHVPLTRDAALFGRAAKLGHQLLRLHTWGERDLEGGQPTREIPEGKASQSVNVAVDTTQNPPAPRPYPADYAYDAVTQTLRVGGGEFAPVAPEVWEYSVSGLQVVKSWLDYRKLEPNGKKSSELDKIRPASWTGEMSDALQDLLWLLEHSLELEPQCTALLEEICAAPVIAASELPKPSEAERKAPASGEESEQTELFEEQQ